MLKNEQVMRYDLNNDKTSVKILWCRTHLYNTVQTAVKTKDM